MTWIYISLPVFPSRTNLKLHKISVIPKIFLTAIWLLHNQFWAILSHYQGDSLINLMLTTVFYLL